MEKLDKMVKIAGFEGEKTMKMVIGMTITAAEVTMGSVYLNCGGGWA